MLAMRLLERKINKLGVRLDEVERDVVQLKDENIEALEIIYSLLQYFDGEEDREDYPFESIEKAKIFLGIETID